jgi:hypothetical protein
LPPVNARLNVARGSRELEDALLLPAS